MPNWCFNELTVSGPADELKRFVFATQGLPAKYSLAEWEKRAGAKESPTQPFFCFEALVPTPQSVLDVGFSADRDTNAIDGYHWNVENWGTKWDVYEDAITPEHMGWFEGCTAIQFSFDTAWSPPIEWLAKVVEMFPELHFIMAYDEPGMGLKGHAGGDFGNFFDYEEEYTEEDTSEEEE